MVSTFESKFAFLLLLIEFETDVLVFHPDVGTVHKENGNKFAQVVQSVVGLDPITLSNMLRDVWDAIEKFFCSKQQNMPLNIKEEGNYFQIYCCQLTD